MAAGLTAAEVSAAMPKNWNDGIYREICSKLGFLTVGYNQYYSSNTMAI